MDIPSIIAAALAGNAPAAEVEFIAANTVGGTASSSFVMRPAVWPRALVIWYW